MKTVAQALSFLFAAPSYYLPCRLWEHILLDSFQIPDFYALFFYFDKFLYGKPQKTSPLSTQNRKNEVTFRTWRKFRRLRKTRGGPGGASYPEYRASSPGPGGFVPRAGGTHTPNRAGPYPKHRAPYLGPGGLDASQTGHPTVFALETLPAGPYPITRATKYDAFASGTDQDGGICLTRRDSWLLRRTHSPTYAEAC